MQEVIMSTITITQNRTNEIFYKFMQDIATIQLIDHLNFIKLLKLTKKLFNDLDKLGLNEFSNFFKEYNFSTLTIKDRKKHQQALNYLIALIIGKYSQSDLLRYFFPEKLSKKESKPEYSSSQSRIYHWFQLIGYWLRQVRDNLKYELNIDNNNIDKSIKYIKSISKQAYTLKNTNDDNFKAYLAILVEKIEENSIHPNLNSIHLTTLANDQEYHQVLIDKEQSLQAFENQLNKKSKKIETRETELLEEEQIIQQTKAALQQRSAMLETQEQFFLEKKEKLEKQMQQFRLSETNLSEKKELFELDVKEITEQKKEYDLKIMQLQMEITDLRSSKNKIKNELDGFENDNYNFQKVLLDLKKNIDPNEFFNILNTHNVNLTVDDWQSSSEEEEIFPELSNLSQDLSQEKDKLFQVDPISTVPTDKQAQEQQLDQDESPKKQEMNKLSQVDPASATIPNLEQAQKKELHQDKLVEESENTKANIGVSIVNTSKQPFFKSLFSKSSNIHNSSFETSQLKGALNNK